MHEETKKAYDLVIQDLRDQRDKLNGLIELMEALSRVPVGSIVPPLKVPEEVPVKLEVLSLEKETQLETSEYEDDEEVDEQASERIVSAPNLEGAILMALQQNGKPMRAPEIAEYLKAAGRQTTISSVYTAARKAAGVKKVDTGLWGLKD